MQNSLKLKRKEMMLGKSNNWSLSPLFIFIHSECRDQGFTRPKVLILLPFRNTAVDLVDSFIKLSATEQQENKNRFYEQYNLREEEDLDLTKPTDFLQNFQGNIDDHFRLGIKFAKKSMKLYADFYNADIIISSPLGLRTLIGSEGYLVDYWYCACVLLNMFL